MAQNLFKRIIYSEFVELNLPFIPKYLSKYDSYYGDLKSLFSYYILNKKREYSPELRGLTIIPTTICNANCVFCANRFLQDKRQRMTFNIFKKIVDEYKKLGGTTISITPTIGDIFTDPDIFQKIKYLEKKKMDYGFYTNGILLHQYVDEVLNSKIGKLNIDIADIIPKYDSEVFQIPEALSKKRLETVLNLLERIEIEKNPLKVQFCFRGKRSPQKILKDLKKSSFYKYHKKGILELSFLQAYDNWGGLITKKDLQGTQVLKRPPRIRKYPCEALYSLSILPDGDIRLCGCRCMKTFHDELVIGNIKKDSLKNLVKSKKWKGLLNNPEIKNLPEVCKNCSFYRPKI
jgi:radical SAM protein with 4Fe4S-binding SPASM domain